MTLIKLIWPIVAIELALLSLVLWDYYIDKEKIIKKYLTNIVTFFKTLRIRALNGTSWETS